MSINGELKKTLKKNISWNENEIIKLLFTQQQQQKQFTSNINNKVIIEQE